MEIKVEQGEDCAGASCRRDKDKVVVVVQWASNWIEIHEHYNN
jgi:hypothetical protein